MHMLILRLFNGEQGTFIETNKDVVTAIIRPCQDPSLELVLVTLLSPRFPRKPFESTEDQRSGPVCCSWPQLSRTVKILYTARVKHGKTAALLVGSRSRKPPCQICCHVFY